LCSPCRRSGRPLVTRGSGYQMAAGCDAKTPNRAARGTLRTWMGARAMGDLVQLGDSDFFFQKLAAGLQHVAENALAIQADAIGLTEQGKGSRILRAVTEEEAAKDLILLDAARGAGDLSARAGRPSQRASQGVSQSPAALPVRCCLPSRSRPRLGPCSPSWRPWHRDDAQAGGAGLGPN